MQNYKDLKVWEKAHLFTLNVYEGTKSFPKEEIYSLTNQVRRGASSIPANIAEGCGKNGKLELAQYLNIALGSANESEYFLILSRDLNYLPREKFDVLFLLINEVKGMLISLINKVRA
ncbi:MAG: four helix bundle protein [Deinococcales bacterium]|nr:four helix bundle protein [Chitinophagaceae bacterium]